MITYNQHDQKLIDNYYSLLNSIQDGYNPPDIRIRIPRDEPIYEVDWNTRKISVPPFLSVEADHSAEIIFFEMDRYYDSMDLANLVGIIQFRNAKNEEYYYVIPYYDTTSVDQKIIFPWNIQSEVTKYGGTVTFSIKFFKMDTVSKKITYEINTLVAKTRVLVGWSSMKGANHTVQGASISLVKLAEELMEKYHIDSTYASELENIIALAQEYRNGQNAGMFWIDV